LFLRHPRCCHPLCSLPAMLRCAPSVPLSLAHRFRAFSSQTAAKRVFLVQAHPVEDSFSDAIARTVAGTLTDAGAEVRPCNLYKMPDGNCFQPLLTMNERATYFDTDKQPQLTEDPHVKAIVGNLRWADSLVLVYPTWWFSTPSVLKGFFDRCFVPGVGFKYDAATGGRTMGLQNIKRCGVVTSYGFDEPTVTKAGDAGKLMIQGGMSMLFHPECEQTWDALYSMQAAQTNDRREEFLAELKTRYSAW